MYLFLLITNLMSVVTVKQRTVRRLVAGQPEAFREIYEAYRHKIFTYALTFTKSVPDAEEVVQQSFIRLWEHRRHVDPKRPLDPYIYRIARNYAFDYLKELARRTRLREDLRQLAPTGTHYESLPIDYERVAEEAISALPEKRQVIFRMNYDEGLSPQEIADTLHLSVHTVKSQLVKATKSLRLLLLRHVSLYLIGFSSLLLF